MLSSSALIYQNFFGRPETQELPYELVLTVLSYLPLDAVPALALVNHEWREAANDNQLWKARFENRYPHEMENVAQKNIINWRNEFKREKQLTPEAHLQRRLERFIASKDSEGDRDYQAAVTLQSVLFGNARVTFLDDFYVQYNYGPSELVAIYSQANRLNLIKNQDNKENDIQEMNACYSRKVFD